MLSDKRVCKKITKNLFADTKIGDRDLYLWCLKESIPNKRLIRVLKKSQTDALMAQILTVVDSRIRKSKLIRKDIVKILKEFYSKEKA